MKAGFHPFRVLFPVLFVLPAFAVSSGPASAVTQYEITTILDRPFGAMLSCAEAMNESGQVCGYLIYSDFDFRACVWEDGASQELSSSWYSHTLAVSINASGQAVGHAHYIDASLPDYYYDALLWDNGTATDLGSLGGHNTQAQGINDSGRIVGWSDTSTSTGDPHAFLWENGVMSDLGTLDGTRSYAYGINASGQVVGWAPTGGTYHAFLWEDGTMSDLGSLGGSSSASAINSSGQVVGSSKTASGDLHAFLWENGLMSDLGTFGGNRSEAEAINASGQVVGYARDASDQARAFLWEDGVMYDLSSLLLDGSDWNLSYAAAITDSGEILASGRGPYGESYSVILTPIPEPSVMAMLAFAFLVALGRLRRGHS